jgi:hypothetical protein
VFADAPSAIRAAVSAQHALEQAEWAGRSRVRVRMGLHTGLGVLGGDDYIGIDINRTARISAAGHGGQILVSGPTRALAEDSVAEGIDFRDLGEYRLKGIEKPERVFQLVVEGLSHDFPPLRTDAIGEAHMPQRMMSFVRRPDEISDVSRLLEESRLITLIGPGRTGKTSLAEEVGRLVAKDYADGAWFVDLASVRDPELVGSAIFTRLGLATKSKRSIACRVVKRCSPTRSERSPAATTPRSCDEPRSCCSAFLDDSSHKSKRHSLGE